MGKRKIALLRQLGPPLMPPQSVALTDPAEITNRAIELAREANLSAKSCMDLSKRALDFCDRIIELWEEDHRLGARIIAELVDADRKNFATFQRMREKEASIWNKRFEGGLKTAAKRRAKIAEKHADICKAYKALLASRRQPREIAALLAKRFGVTPTTIRSVTKALRPKNESELTSFSSRPVQ